MRTYRVVEDRSCGIVHTKFTGSLEDCKKWLKDNCCYDEDTNDYYSNVVFCDRSLIYIDDTCNDPENVNGNNDPFTYDNEEKLSKALQDFKTKYPSVTSADLQTFIIGWQEAVKNCFIPIEEDE